MSENIEFNLTVTVREDEKTVQSLPPTTSPLTDQSSERNEPDISRRLRSGCFFFGGGGGGYILN